MPDDTDRRVLQAARALYEDDYPCGTPWEAKEAGDWNRDRFVKKATAALAAADAVDPLRASGPCDVHDADPLSSACRTCGHLVAVHTKAPHGYCTACHDPVRQAVERAVNEGRNVLPDATDDQATVIERWAAEMLGLTPPIR